MTPHIQPQWADACADIALLVSGEPIRGIAPRLEVVR